MNHNTMKYKINIGSYLMTKFMCMIRDGKFIYWTDDGWRIESPEPMRDIDLEQLMTYPSWKK